MHNNKIKAEENTTNVAVQAEPETETTTLPDGIETTVDAEGHVVPVTDESGNFVYTTATPETTIAAIESTAANVNNNTNNTAGGNKGSSSNTGSSNNKSTGGNKTNSGNKNNSGNKGNSGGSNSSGGGNNQQSWRPITEADVKAIVEEAKSYARSKGITIDSSLTKYGTTWGPETGVLYKSTPETRAKCLKDVKYDVDDMYKRMKANFTDEEWKKIEQEHPETIAVNIFYEYRPNDSEEPYYIYVVC